MSDDRHRAQALQAAGFLGLALDPAHLDGVADNLALLERHAAIVLRLPLAFEAEPAPVFMP